MVGTMTYGCYCGGISALPVLQRRRRRVSSPFNNTGGGGPLIPQSLYTALTPNTFTPPNNFSNPTTTTNSSNSNNAATDDNDEDDASNQTKKVPFGYSRKDVILIGLGVTFLGIALKTGLEFSGVDPLQAGNVVQLVLVLGLTVGWISTYIFRVSNKEMTYAQQLRDYESKVMEKRLESLTEAELQVLLQEVEEEKSR